MSTKNRISTSNGSIALVPQESNYAIIEIIQSVPTEDYAYTYLDVDQLLELREKIDWFLEENAHE